MTHEELVAKVEEAIDTGDYEPGRQARIAIRIVVEACVAEVRAGHLCGETAWQAAEAIKKLGGGAR